MTTWRRWVVLLALLAAIPASAKKNAAPVPPATEFRALWVDGFHAGIRTPEEAQQLVADAKKAGFNALIVQVRRRGDAYYTRSIEPPVEDPAYDPTFDALAYVVELAHREGLEVHAWVNAMPLWRDAAPPSDPRHVFNQHGTAQTGAASWLTASPAGEQKFPVGYFLDAGHPAAAEHVAQVCANLVKNYNVDGIHLDYIRYPETEQPSPKGAPVGYNSVSLERFRRAMHRTDVPAPDDAQWIAWRRQQITQLVRRIYLETKAVNPRLRVSAAVIPWGRPPSNEHDFEQTAPMQRVFQDWHGWLKEGILDMAVPMNYAREGDPVRRNWFDGWIQWEKHHKHERQLAVGLGGYLNPPEATLAQIERVRRPDHGKTTDGMSLFSYASLQKAPPPSAGAGVAPVAARGESVLPNVSLPFNSGALGPAATVPKPEWLENPKYGWIFGLAQDGGAPGDGASVELRRKGWSPFRRTRRVLADGNGFFGYSDVKPGNYELRVGGARAVGVAVTAGQVARTQINLQGNPSGSPSGQSR